MIRIYGASDDIVTIDGHDAGDEIGAYDSDVIVILGAVGPGGVAVRMTYDPQVGSGVAFGCWTSEIGQLDEDVPIPWPISITTYDRGHGKGAGYSVCVNIDAPADVVMRVEKVKRGAA